MSTKELDKGFVNSTIAAVAVILCGVSTRGVGPPNHFASSDQELQLARHNHGRRAGSTNRAVVPLAPVLPPKGLHFELDSHGVYLIWEIEEDPEIRSSLVKFDYHIYRREKSSAKRVAVPYLRAVVHRQEGERWSAVDMSIEWEKTIYIPLRP